MARKKITANLNGGDSVTAMGDLQFQVHNADDNSIISTANYAAIGSVNNNGTDGLNINYTLNPTYDPGSGLLGQIILDGVDVGSASEIKIRCKDEDGNESILSDAVSVLVLFEDTFTGTIIDTVKWPTNVNGGHVTTSQNNEISMISTGNSDESSLTNYLMSTGINASNIKVVSFDLNLNGYQNVNDWYVGISGDATITDSNNQVGFKKSTSATGCFAQVKLGGTASNNAITVDLKSAPMTVKIFFDTSDIKFYNWNGSAWNLLHTETNTISGTWYPFFRFEDKLSQIREMNVDNFYVTNADFATQYPV